METREQSTFDIQHQHRTADASAFETWVLNDGNSGRRKSDLEARLLEFASAVIDLSEGLPDTRAGNHVTEQLLRSGTAPYPLHAEAEAADSREDFIRKMSVCLKELREARRWMRLIKQKGWATENATLLFLLSESDELVRIFYSSIQTAKINALVDRKKPSAGGGGHSA